MSNRDISFVKFSVNVKLYRLHVSSVYYLFSRPYELRLGQYEERERCIIAVIPAPPSHTVLLRLHVVVFSHSFLLYVFVLSFWGTRRSISPKEQKW